MTGSSAKKRNRETTPVDVASDKKLKGGKEAARGANGTVPRAASAAVINGIVDTPVPSTSPARGGKTKAPPSKAFTSPAITSKGDREETPYFTTQQDKPPKTLSKKHTPSKLVKKLDAVQEEGESAKKPKATNGKSPQVKVVRRGSFFFTTFLLFLWIASSATLGGLFLVEKLNHELHVFQLEQELLEKYANVGDKVPDKQELLKLVEELKGRTAEAEFKLAGYKLEFQESLTKLEAE
mmetsp:Transcript_30619/g.50568  ORF Transcript_30619/g.50568 Transcript_30619/m.50568 type:complete len:238 (+) Transcript_30619:39-752(+)|eukprot:CAMPEP_0119014408 /NCGR_PEP_ID=MMETSP1176-20130426/9678_1 /TAXON_ID=265551 /ORGANISM="Synedropsis recta cf, Strain CCMP1620" /LENGTH=237 /DNA_ID=CAMNT_0006967579 /DNA_START=21 /DNA_END=734 /DNA_ORIENTATION=+